jgi:choline-glycine betaine transporter
MMLLEIAAILVLLPLATLLWVVLFSFLRELKQKENNNYDND